MNKWEQFKNNIKEINRLEEENYSIEEELLKPYIEAHERKFHPFKRTKLKLFSASYKCDNDRKYEENVEYVHISFEDSYDGEMFDTTQVPVSHLLSGEFDDDDFQTNRDREDIKHKKEKEKEERKQYEELKKKFEK